MHLGTRQFAYDSSGNLSQYTDRNGQIRQYQYDSSGNVASETWYATRTMPTRSAERPENTIQYTRDSAGDILSETDDSSSDTYVYNDAGQITSTTETTVGGPTVVLAYQYDSSGDRTQMAATIDGTADFVDDYTYNSRRGRFRPSASASPGGRCRGGRDGRSHLQRRRAGSYHRPLPGQPVGGRGRLQL